MMESRRKGQELETLPTGVFEVPGEPAIVISGVPDGPLNDAGLVHCDIMNHEASLCQKTVFGAWMEGREIRKLFGKQYYTGTVTRFDSEAGWYRVVYEDGDFEDLEWHELEEVLVPLDVSIPLKSLALKIIKKNQRPYPKPEKEVPKCGNRRPRKALSIKKTGQLPEEESPLKFNGNHSESVDPTGGKDDATDPKV